LQDSAVPLDAATYVCVDLPGYGGSESFDKHDTTVLDALVEFIVAMRKQYLAVDDQGTPVDMTYVVAHDWGGVAAFRLASEAGEVADRFLLVNAPCVCGSALFSLITD
jgi:pimeloyl-ACP methyl ester carboxylesterase